MLKEILLISCVFLALGSALPVSEEGILKDTPEQPVEAILQVPAGGEEDLNTAENYYRGWGGGGWGRRHWGGGGWGGWGRGYGGGWGGGYGYGGGWGRRGYYW